MPFQIFQSEGHFLIAYEFADAVRDIYLEDPGPSVLDAWMGQSVGRWEDDTFVVEVDAFNGMTWFDRAGNHHSAALKVTERYTLVTPYHIWYEATMEDENTSLPSLDHPPAALQADRSQRPVGKVQVHRIRRGADVRPPAQDARGRRAGAAVASAAASPVERGESR